MEDITIQVSEDLSHALKQYEGHLDEVLRLGIREFRMAQALGLYQKGGLSLWKTARMAEVSLKEMARYAVAQGVQAPCDEDMIEEEIA